MWQLYTLGVGKFFCMLKFDLYEGRMTPTPRYRSSGKTTCYTAL